MQLGETFNLADIYNNVERLKGAEQQREMNALQKMYMGNQEARQQQTFDNSMADRAAQQQGQKNELAQQQQVAEAKRYLLGADYVDAIPKDAPEGYVKQAFQQAFPDIVQQMPDFDKHSDASLRSLVPMARAKWGPIAGVGPAVKPQEKFGNPTPIVRDGRNALAMYGDFGTEKVVPNAAPYEKPQQPAVNVNVGGSKFESTAEQEYGKLEGQAFSAVVQRGQDAADKAGILRAMNQNPAITGPTQDFRASANSLMKDLGVPVAAGVIDQVSNLGQYKALVNQMVLTEQLKQKGPQTESDAKRIAETFGKTTNIQETNRMIVNYQLALADRETLIAQMAEDYRQHTGKIDGWRKHLREYVNSTPLAGLNPQSGRLVFWNEFQDSMKEDHPALSDEEVMGIWRSKYGNSSR